MKYSITIPNLEHFRREEFIQVGIDSLETLADADEVYIGDLLWHVDSPKDFLAVITNITPSGTVFYIENYFIYEICRNLITQLIDTARFNQFVFGFGFKRIFDNIDTIKLLRHCGLEVIHESIESNKMCISFKKI